MDTETETIYCVSVMYAHGTLYYLHTGNICVWLLYTHT